MPSVAFGQTKTGKLNRDPYFFAAVCSAVGATLVDGSFLICKAGGVAWFVAPASTQITSQWANGQYNSTAVGNKCCVSEWTGLSAALLNAGFAPTQWFVPSPAQIQNPGGTCCANWGADNAPYWSSGEVGATDGCIFYFNYGQAICFNTKLAAVPVRAMRCVTY